jgi:hypothetical protein
MSFQLDLSPEEIEALRRNPRTPLDLRSEGSSFRVSVAIPYYKKILRRITAMARTLILRRPAKMQIFPLILSILGLCVNLNSRPKSFCLMISTF